MSTPCLSFCFVFVYSFSLALCLNHTLYQSLYLKPRWPFCGYSVHVQAADPAVLTQGEANVPSLLVEVHILLSNHSCEDDPHLHYLLQLGRINKL